MPTYEYRRPDGTTFEVIQKMSEDALTKDPDTGVPVERVLHAPSVHFKGKGFYNTDYGTKKRSRELNQAASDGADKHDEKHKAEKDKAKSSDSDSSSSSSSSPSKSSDSSSSSSGSSSTTAKKSD